MADRENATVGDHITSACPLVPVDKPPGVDRYARRDAVVVPGVSVDRWSVRAEARTPSPPEVVWPLLAQAHRWSEWSTVRHADLEREGDPAPDGVGAVRRFRTGPVTTREEVVEFEPPRRLVYTMLSGLPVRGYRATVELDPDDGGTRITWTSTFEAAPRGTAWFWRSFLRITIRGFSRRLARRASVHADQ